jgi:hypothetical protein
VSGSGDGLWQQREEDNNIVQPAVGHKKMMKSFNAILFVGRHILAGICSTAFIAILPIVVYGILVVMGVILFGDVGGPLNFILIPILSLALGVVLSGFVYAPLCLLLAFLRRRWHISPWLPPSVCLLASFLLFLALLRPTSPPLVVIFGVPIGFAFFFTTGFGIYLFTAMSSEKAVNFVRRMASKYMQPTS